MIIAVSWESAHAAHRIRAVSARRLDWRGAGCVHDASGSSWGVVNAPVYPVILECDRQLVSAGKLGLSQCR